MVDTREPSPHRQTWQREFGIKPVRLPRAGVEHVRKLLASAWPPELELRENHATNTTEIVIRFRGTSQELPEPVREVYFRFGMTLDKAFQEILRTVLQQKTLRAELTGLGYNAYREAWLHIIRMLYLDCFHDVTNKWLREEQIEPLERDTSRGRRGKESEIDRGNLRKRYSELLDIARRVHDAAAQAVDNYKTQAWKIPAADTIAHIRAGIWKRVKDLYGTRVAHLIFSGEAFLLISTEDERYVSEDKRFLVRLERPEDWSAEDLATALLALEEGKHYKTIRSKLKGVSRNPAATKQ